MEDVRAGTAPRTWGPSCSSEVPPGIGLVPPRRGRSVLTALAFDFTNGFHDTANSMAMSIATGALRPRVAVAVAGALNLAGAFLSTEVAKTISGGIVDDALRRRSSPGGSALSCGTC